MDLFHPARLFVLNPSGLENPECGSRLSRFIDDRRQLSQVEIALATDARQKGLIHAW